MDKIWRNMSSFHFCNAIMFSAFWYFFLLFLNFFFKSFCALIWLFFDQSETNCKTVFHCAKLGPYSTGAVWRAASSGLEGLGNFGRLHYRYRRRRALPLWRLNRAWLAMSKFGYLNKKQGHFKLTMLWLFIYLLIYYNNNCLFNCSLHGSIQ